MDNSSCPHSRTNALSRNTPKRAWIFSLYLILALASVRAKVFITPCYFNGTLATNHARSLNGVSTAPNQYRLLEYYIPQFIHAIFRLNIVDAYVLQRFVWTALTFIVFHIYLRKWFDGKVSVIGTLFLAATMQWTYFNHIKECEPLNILIFLLGLYAIREGAWRWLLRILIVGAFNKSTVIFLPLIYFFCWYRVVDLKKLCLRTVLLFAPVIVICGAIRWIYREVPYETSLFKFTYNVHGFIEEAGQLPFRFYWAPHLYIFFLYGIFWIMAFMSFGEKPLFLRRAALIIPLFIITHLVIARIDEARLFLPLAPIIIPMGLFSLFGENSSAH